MCASLNPAQRHWASVAEHKLRLRILVSVSKVQFQISKLQRGYKELIIIIKAPESCDNFLETYLMRSKTSGLSRSLSFMRSFMAMIMVLALSSAPCFELFSAAPRKNIERSFKTSHSRFSTKRRKAALGLSVLPKCIETMTN